MNYKKETFSACVGCPDRPGDCGRCKKTEVTLYCDDCGKEIAYDERVFITNDDCFCEKCINGKMNFLWKQLSDTGKKLFIDNWMSDGRTITAETTLEEANDFWDDAETGTKIWVLGFDDYYDESTAQSIMKDLAERGVTCNEGIDNYTDDDFLPF